MKTKIDLATVADHVGTLAENFHVSPATVCNWIHRFNMSAMPSKEFVAYELTNNSHGRRRDTLEAARQIVADSGEPFLVAFREGLKRS